MRETTSRARPRQFVRDFKTQAGTIPCHAEPLRILAGDCTVTYEDSDEIRKERGNVLVITKTDNC
jgi:uncharacterized cupin superfamily protein